MGIYCKCPLALSLSHSLCELLLWQKAIQQVNTVISSLCQGTTVCSADPAAEPGADRAAEEPHPESFLQRQCRGALMIHSGHFPFYSLCPALMPTPWSCDYITSTGSQSLSTSNSKPQSSPTQTTTPPHVAFTPLMPPHHTTEGQASDLGWQSSLRRETLTQNSPLQKCCVL